MGKGDACCIPLGALEEKVKGIEKLTDERLDNAVSKIDGLAVVVEGMVKNLAQGVREFDKTNVRLREGDQRFNNMQQEISAIADDYRKHHDLEDKDGAHFSIMARLQKHFYGKDGAHSKIDRKQTINTIIVIVILGVSLKGEFGPEIIKYLNIVLKIFGLAL